MTNPATFNLIVIIGGSAPQQRGEFQHAVFLSGNGPLVDVLREALSRDELAQAQYGQTL